MHRRECLAAVGLLLLACPLKVGVGKFQPFSSLVIIGMAVCMNGAEVNCGLLNSEANGDAVFTADCDQRHIHCETGGAALSIGSGTVTTGWEEGPAGARSDVTLCICCNTEADSSSVNFPVCLGYVFNLDPVDIHVCNYRC